MSEIFEAAYKVKAKHKQLEMWLVGVPMKIENKYMLLLEDDENLLRVHYTDHEMWLAEIYAVEIDENTICRPTGLTDKNENKIWENDILMCHSNRNDLVKACYGEFYVIDAGSLEKIDSVIGWHYEVIGTDAISKCEPFNISMPLTNDYIISCELEVVGNVFDNPELLKEGAE